MKTIKLNGKRPVQETGNLESFFNDGTKLYAIVNRGTHVTISQKRCNNLFNFLYNNWDKIMIEYTLYNSDKKTKFNTLNWYINDDRLDELKKGLPGITDKIVIGFSKRHLIMVIMNKTTYEIHKKEEDKNYINDLEYRCRLANFAPFTEKISVDGKGFEWDEDTIKTAEDWLKEHHPEIQSSHTRIFQPEQINTENEKNN
jgi:hypothetical protein